MIGNRWLCEPDDERESWCFLTLEREDSAGKGDAFAGWEISYGNPRKIVRSLNSESNEKESLQDLSNELHYCRSEGITVFNFRENALPALRTHLLLNDIGVVSLRGIENIPIERLLKENFHNLELNPSKNGLDSIPRLCETVSIQTENFSNTELLWKVLLKIGPLLPEDSLTG